MSSNRKDARWYLAQRMVREAGVDWDDVSYPTHDATLFAAEQVLGHLSQSQIDELAEKWRANDE